MSDLFADLFAACSIFFYSRIDELSELSGYSLFFLSLLPRRPWPKAKRLVDGVNHTLLEGDLAQDHIPTLAPLERTPHKEGRALIGTP